MSQEKIEFRFTTGKVDVRDRPPVVTFKGIPALPGESWREYCRRAEPILYQMVFQKEPKPTNWPETRRAWKRLKASVKDYLQARRESKERRKRLRQ